MFPAEESNDNMLRFVDLLSMTTDWMSANQVAVFFGMPMTENSRRIVRGWAEASDGKIIGGQRGYRFYLFASTEEIRHSSEKLISQGKKMIRRGIRIRRLAHQVVG